MEQSYRANVLIVNMVGMLPGASVGYTSLSMNVQHIKIGCILTHPRCGYNKSLSLYHL
ncbi:MAG: hypothetical protein HDS88_04845 [Bacteroidales bacterium]|nr:hypothetical protein [Bacteroidales bacterium]